MPQKLGQLVNLELCFFQRADLFWVGADLFHKIGLFFQNCPIFSIIFLLCYFPQVLINKFRLCFIFTEYSPGDNIKIHGKYWLSMRFNSVFLSEKVSIDRKFYLIMNLCKRYLR